MSAHQANYACFATSHRQNGKLGKVLDEVDWGFITYIFAEHNWKKLDIRHETVAFTIKRILWL